MKTARVFSSFASEPEACFHTKSYSKEGKYTIHLNGKRAFDADRCCVDYDAVLDGKNVHCAISRDALQYYFEDMDDPPRLSILTEWSFSISRSVP